MHGIIFGQFDNFSVYPSIHVLPLIHVRVVGMLQPVPAVVG